MKTVRERDQVREIHAKWSRLYKVGIYKEADDMDKRVYALDLETATADDVAAAIGNRSWADRMRCDECGQQSWDIVEIGEEPDYESRTCYACADCLRAALRLLEEPTP